MQPEALRIATYNVEWFDRLFDDHGRLLNDHEPSARYNVTRAAQTAALGAVFTAIDADAIMIIEGPDTGSKRSNVTALRAFARHFGLRTSAAISGYPSETEQEIGLLYDPAKFNIRHDPKGVPSTTDGAADAPRFDTVFRHDVDQDGSADLIRFSKPPLELDVTTAAGHSLRLIGVHAKSKAPHGARRDADVIRLSIDNRRKQLAQCIWVRGRVEGHLRRGESLIVLGDFNDGPGLDAYEKMFGQSGVEVVLGPATDPAMQLFDPHAHMVLTQRVGIVPTTARFYLAPQKRYFEALIDFIMVSPDLAALRPQWRIWHPLNDPDVFQNQDLARALLTASDHFPVTIDLVLGQDAATAENS